MPQTKTAYNRAYYVRHKEAIAARNLATRIALGQTMPAGHYLAHCGQWQRLTSLPYTCTICGERFFVPEGTREKEECCKELF